MASLVDWTIDRLLSSVQTINTQSAQVGARIKADRARYMETLRALPSVSDANAREQLRTQLGAWIHKQVDVENRYNSFAAAFATAKAKARDWLKAVNITPPAYLNAVPALVPAAIVAGIVLAVATLAVLATQNNLQGKSLDGLATIVNNAAARGWTADETAAAVDAYRRANTAAAAAAGAPDPLGIANALRAALPIVVGIAALKFLPPIVAQLRQGARR